MRLSEFILRNLEQILTEWKSFAATVLPESKFTKIVLRDSAEEILKTIAKDMEAAQTPLEQAEKSKGRARPTQVETSAEIHAAERLRLDFNQAELVSEYRALRATVTRLCRIVHLTWGTNLTFINSLGSMKELIRPLLNRLFDSCKKLIRPGI